MINKRFGKLVVIKRSNKKMWGGYTWDCICDCGNETTASTAMLNRKTCPKRSCGCESIKSRIKSEDVIGYKNPRWNGGKTIDSYGYRWVMAKDHPDSVKNGYIREHRLVAEKKIGRRLKPTESIHHINFDKLDNRPDNLMVFSSESEHQKYHQNLLRKG